MAIDGAAARPLAGAKRGRWRQVGNWPDRSQPCTVWRLTPSVRAIRRTGQPWLCRANASSNRARRAACRSGASGAAEDAGGTSGAARVLRSASAAMAVAACRSRWCRSSALAKAPPRLRRRCQRSLTWTAPGAPLRIPSAYAPARSRATISTPGWSFGHAPTNRLRVAVGQHVDWTVALQVDNERAVALATAPGPVADADHPRRRGHRQRRGAARIRRSSVSPLTGMASRDARRAPASPPALKAMRRWASARRAVRLSRGGATAGSRSAKMRRGHAGPEHRKRRTCRSIRPARPCQGRSPGRRTYRLWPRCERRRQSGHAAASARARTVTTTRSWATAIRSTVTPTGSRDSSDLDKAASGIQRGTSYRLCAHPRPSLQAGRTENAAGPD